MFRVTCMPARVNCVRTLNTWFSTAAPMLRKNVHNAVRPAMSPARSAVTCSCTDICIAAPISPMLIKPDGSTWFTGFAPA